MTPLLLLLAALAPAGARAEPVPAWSPAPAAYGKVFLTVPEALALAFPECEVERQTVYLTEEQEQRVHALSKNADDPDVHIAHPYVATRAGALVGTAYFDTHEVRSLRETLMVVVAPDDTLARVEVLAFAEPLDYMPRDSWYAQFPGRPLDDELDMRRAIKPVTGATLTARATLRAARRALAVHVGLREPEPPKPAPEQDGERAGRGAEATRD